MLRPDRAWIIRNASGDAQYFLYWKTSRKEDFVRCQNYIEDNYGRHTGCRFQNVTIEGSRKGYFMVNESRNGQNILLCTTMYLYKIEKLSPPLNVTVNCTGVSHSCEIQWQRPLTSHVDRDICFKYKIVIEKKEDPEERIKNTYKMERNITGNSYIFESFDAKKRYSVKIRATNNYCLVSENWGEWSAPVEFGREQLTSISSYTLLLISAIAASLILFFCIITIYLKTVPAIVLQPKNPFHDISLVNFQTENQFIKHETEEIITIIEEVA